MRATLRGQWHECPACCHTTLQRNSAVGDADYRAPKCGDCGFTMWPLWDVLDRCGRVVGRVAGVSHADALLSLSGSAAFDRYHSATVAPATEMRA
jgi:hypothetical protein